MKTYFDCIPCAVRQVLDSVRLTTDDEQIQEQVLREALRLAGKLDFRQSPPAMAQKIHRFIREQTGVEDPYLEIKNCFNKSALQMYPDLKERIATSSDPLETAVRLAIAGNIIDFGVNSVVEQKQVEKAVAKSLTAPLDIKALKNFRDAIDKAKDILYIADNAGEIVFDRLLVEQLPREKITFVVKGRPILNDATIKDARAVGLIDLVKVIDNGSDAPGTIMDDCSEAFRHRFDKADLVIAKGQGNFETLSDVDKNIFFLLQPKCVVLARHLDCKVGSLVLVSFRHQTS